VVSGSDRLPKVGELVAAKEYRPDILRVQNQLHRIRQEADIGSRIDHPNVVRTFGLLGDDLPPDGDSGSPLVLLLEWIDGRTLDSWYGAQSKPVPWEVIRGISRDLVAALADLHKSNVFHRDVKPENVMIRNRGSAVLMDIGVAELTGTDETTLHTSVKDFVGSARYASPQFILGTTAFAASDDVYGLGATLFLPFTGTSIFSEVERKSVIPIFVVNGQPAITGLADGVPATMKVLLQGMLHRDPKRRPTLAEVGECLENSESAAYLTTELSRQANDVRSYAILNVQDGSFFADLAGDTPKLDETYTVVRPLKKQIAVPSYNRQVTPEMWVAEATLKHTHQNLGHFAIHRKHWRDAPGSLASMGFGGGQWLHEEGTELKVSPGDLVLRKTTK
jgi:serine/threonine protein kinase